MRNAFAFIVIKDLSIINPRLIDSSTYMHMVIVAARKMREVGYKEDIILISNCPDYEPLCAAEDIRFEYREVLLYKALNQYKCAAWHLSLFDMQKIHYWSLINYDKVLCLDADMLPTSYMFTDWSINGVGVVCGLHGGINSGMMLIEPNETDYNKMTDILLKSEFSIQTGWNQIGPISTPCGEIITWDFQAANAAQGFIPYFFRDRLVYMGDQIYGRFVHYAGDKKHQDEYYISEYKRLLSRMYN